MNENKPNMNTIPNPDIGYTDLKSIVDYTVELLDVIQNQDGIRHLLEAKDTIEELKVLQSLINID